MNSPVESASYWSTAELADDKPALSDFDGSDVADFHRQLQGGPQSAAAKQAAGPQSMGDMLNAVAHSLHRQDEDLSRTLRRFSATADPILSLKMQSQLSQLFLEHGLAVKVVGKSVQALDSLSRLQ